MTREMIDINLECYRSKNAIDDYKTLSPLFAAEEMIFANEQKALRGEILDIGIGGGRTTRYLAKNAKRYVGIDYAPEMIDAAKKEFPGFDLRVMDMRKVPETFKGRNFDLILLSFNTIDYISHQDRIELLKGLKLLLTGEGVLIFSSHHLEYGLGKRGFRTSFIPSINPLKFLVRILRMFRQIALSLPNYLKNRKFEKIDNGYALLNDWAHSYKLLTYYISPQFAVKQIKDAGFNGSIKSYHPFNPNSNTYSDVSWIYYVAKNRL